MGVEWSWCSSTVNPFLSLYSVILIRGSLSPCAKILPITRQLNIATARNPLCLIGKLLGWKNAEKGPGFFWRSRGPEFRDVLILLRVWLVSGFNLGKGRDLV